MTKTSRMIAIIVTGALAVLALLLLNKRRVLDGGPGRRFVEMDLRTISGAIWQYHIGTGRWITDAELASSALLYSNLSDGIVSGKHIRFLKSDPRWDNAKRLIDRWGQDYGARILKRTNAGVDISFELQVC